MGSFLGVFVWTQADYSNLLQQISSVQLQINQIQTLIQTQGRTTMSALDDLTAQVAANTSAESSAVQLISGLAEQIAEAAAGGDSAALTNLAAQLKTSATALAAAIAANTAVNPESAP